MLHFRNLFLSFSNTLLTLILCLAPSGEAIYKLPKNVTFTAFFVFGDSIVDTGNNNNVSTVFKANFPPYGTNYKGGIPTGRYCDGKVPVDFLAEEFGIKASVPAYLDPELRPEDLITGVNFASGGSGYDPLTSTILSVISLSQQVEYFKEYKKKLEASVGHSRTHFILSNAVFLVVASSNDIAITYFSLPFRQFQYDVPSYTDLMLQFASSFFKEIYDLGARRIGVFSAPPVGCMPAQRTLGGGINRECAADLNMAAILFNTKLCAELDSLNKKLPDSRMVYIDVYNPFKQIVDEPKKYGFEIVDKGCCGAGELEVSVLCNAQCSVCEDASKYVFWDSFHPTEKTYKIIVSQLLDKYVSKFF